MVEWTRSWDFPVLALVCDAVSKAFQSLSGAEGCKDFPEGQNYSEPGLFKENKGTDVNSFVSWSLFNCDC